MKRHERAKRLFEDREEASIVIIDPSGVILTPGNHGKNCKGNGEHHNENGDKIECCCDECDYYLYCHASYIYKK